MQGVTYQRLEGVFAADHENGLIFGFFLFLFSVRTALPIELVGEETVVAALFVNCRSRVYSNIVQASRLTNVFTDTVSWSWMDMASDSGVFGQLLPLNGP